MAIRQPDGKINLKQSINLVGVGAASGGLSGAFWGSLAGLLFLNPLVGFAVGRLVGAGSGTLSGSLVDYSIDDNFHQVTCANVEARQFRPVRPYPQGATRKSPLWRVLRSSLSP